MPSLSVEAGTGTVPEPYHPVMPAAPTSAAPPAPVTRARRLRSSARDLAHRARRRAVSRFSDLELDQLRALQKAYAGPGGPELLVFGDSAMFWSEYTDDDRTGLADLVRERLDGVGMQVLMGPGYNPRIVAAYLEALARCAGRPQVVVVPTSVLMASSLWIDHPLYGYGRKTAQLREVIAGTSTLKRLDPPAQEDYEEWDRRPAPSLFGARRTAGELRLITNSPPQTRWQTALRTRHLMDFYHAEELTLESVGVRLIEEAAAAVSALGLRSLGYVSPVNHEVLKVTLGEASIEHVRRNVAVIEEAYLRGAGDLGRVLDASLACPTGDFADPLHLNEHGRHVMADLMADALRPLLGAAR